MLIRTLWGTGSCRDPELLLREECEGEPWLSWSARRRCGLYMTVVTYFDLYLHVHES